MAKSIREAAQRIRESGCSLERLKRKRKVLTLLADCLINGGSYCWLGSDDREWSYVVGAEKRWLVLSMVPALLAPPEK
jgi:hypothetical protein